MSRDFFCKVFLMLFSKPRDNPDDQDNHGEYEENPDAHSGLENITHQFAADQCKRCEKDQE